ncbi:MAG: hypothetical protein L6Q99_07325 [Planctomycetes bacterium]|nr:hypothetical protein [Planctomycetota bacterium]
MPSCSSNESASFQLTHYAPFPAALKEPSVQPTFYRKNCIPNVWRDAHRHGAEMIEARLGPDGFAKKSVTVKALLATELAADRAE